jgi:tetratricopeptide (TPR) repeat protein
MSEQPTALRLADELADYTGFTVVGMDQAAAELRRLHEVEKQYHELLYTVGNKYKDESRYQTALRYIQQAEAYNNTAVAKVEESTK